MWQQTLPQVESLSDQLDEVDDWQIATWVLTVVCALLVLALVIVLAVILLAKRRRNYSAGGATLRRKEPRSSTYGPSEDKAVAS